MSSMKAGNAATDMNVCMQRTSVHRFDSSFDLLGKQRVANGAQLQMAAMQDVAASDPALTAHAAMSALPTIDLLLPVSTQDCAGSITT